jgi:hypothetical protein
MQPPKIKKWEVLAVFLSFNLLIYLQLQLISPALERLRIRTYFKRACRDLMTKDDQGAPGRAFHQGQAG